MCVEPAQSVLGVTLDNSGWQSKLLTCGKFDSNSTHVGASVLGAGFWQMSFEDHVRRAKTCCMHIVSRAAAHTGTLAVVRPQLHHEVSTAARMAMRGLDTHLHS